MHNPNHSRSWFHFILISLLVALALGISLPVTAQEATEEPEAVEIEPQVEDSGETQDEEPATEAPTDIPTTEAPTTEPTIEIPTEAPTTEPTAEIPTEAPTEPTVEIPTEAPTEEPATEIPVESPTDETLLPTDAPTDEPVITVPPVFNTDLSAVFEATAGVPFTLSFSVSDETGAVTLAADTGATVGAVALDVAAPVESEAPFNTTATFTYVAPADYSGADTFLLTATDADGLSISALVVVNVTLPPTVEVTLDATATSTPTATPTDIPLEDYEELLVKYDPNATEGEIQAIIASLNGIEVDRIPQIGTLVVKVPPQSSRPNDAMAALQSAGIAAPAGVSAVERNGYIELLYEPNDPYYQNNAQRALGRDIAQTTGSIDAARAWSVATNRGSGVVIAVIDSGVQLNHADLKNQLVTGWDFFDDDTTPNDTIGHGTQVAGIIAAQGNNGIGMAGVAFNAKIMPLKVCDIIDDDGSFVYGCPYSYVAGAIVHAVDNGAKVVNLSLGGTSADSEVIRAAVDYAVTRNVTVIAAAGNTGDASLVYPAAFPNVISVGAHDPVSGTIADFSTRNNRVDFSAPGTNILSTTIGNSYIDQELDGTSFAAAHVSGIAALLISQGVANTPALVEDALICGATDAGDPGRDDAYGYGRVNANFSMDWNGNSADCHVTVANDSIQGSILVNSLAFSYTQQITDRNATEHASDPDICGEERQQTVWFRFRPSAAGFYQFNTYGSTYDTAIGVFQGNGSALSEIACTEGKQVVAELVNGFTYYIAVGTIGAEVETETLRFGAASTIIVPNQNAQENSTAISYSGTWALTALTGASGGKVMQTTDLNAGFSFAFRGMEFNYVRTVGPGRGRVYVTINGTPFDADPSTVDIDPIDNRGAITRPNSVFAGISIPGAQSGQWNLVEFKIDPTTPGLVDLDRIIVRDFDGSSTLNVITTKTDNATANTYRWGAGWNSGQGSVPANYGAINNKVRVTNAAGTTVTFRVQGNAIRIFRVVGPDEGDMEVIVDNGAPIFVNNTAGTAKVRPVTLVGFATTQHVVTIRTLEAKRFRFDAAQGLSLGILPNNRNIDDRDTRLVFNGVFSNQNNITGAVSQTTRTLNSGTEMVFQFKSNDICIRYRTKSGGGSIMLEIDDTRIDMNGVDANRVLDPTNSVLSTNAGGSQFRLWCLRANGDQILANQLHVATLTATGGQVIIDYVRPQVYQALTPARGVVNETDAAFIFSNKAAWTTVSGVPAQSLGGYRPQGGAYYEAADVADNGQTITFFMNGTGFLLYTVVDQSMGCFDVNIDDDPTVYVRPGGIGVRRAPMAFGFTGLEPGIHRVELKVNRQCIGHPDAPPSGFIGGGVIFDAVRVFP